MKKNTPFAAQITMENAICMLIDQGIKQTEVMISGPNLGRNTTLQAIQKSSVILNFVRDVIPMPHNGCRPPKQRCV
jgi:small subunit ribosomal protein S11